VKRYATLGIAFACATALSTIALAAAMPSPIIVTPSQITWESNSSLPGGVKMATLSGDSTKAGWYVVRFNMPDGAKFPPHFHGGAEYVTVIQGTLLVGLGTTMDMSKMKALPAGSYVEVPAKLPHYAAARGNTVIQISGSGPMTMTAAGH
jgi:quercetin dioxygenase-like cupin family protein